MSRHTDEEVIVPCIRVISPETAAKLGYVEITNTIHPIRESAIFDSVQQSLRTCDSIWIEKAGGYFAAARKRSDLKTIAEGAAL